MLSARLAEISQAPNAPFLRAQTDRDLFVRTIEVTSLDAIVARGNVERGLAALVTELARVARFGFTAPELSRMKLNLQRGLERAVVEKDKSPSGPLADEFIRNFILDEPIPGIVYEYGLNQRFLPEITLAEVNSVAKSWMADRNRLVAISAPENDKATLPNDGQARGRDQRHRHRAADGVRRHDRATSRCWPASRPPARLRTRPRRMPLGITEWTLSNGVARRAQADDVQAGRDRVPGRQSGGNLARE